MERGMYVVALELGTSKISGVVALKEKKRMRVIAIEQEESQGAIKRGSIQNVEETAAKVRKIIVNLEAKVPGIQINKVFVGVAGQSLHSVDHVSYRHLPEETQISDELLLSIYNEARDTSVFNAEVLEVLPTEFVIDNRLETNPSGIFCSEIRSNLKLIVGRATLKKNLYRCISERVKTPIADYVVAPIATAEVLLSENERNLGCALVDFGASTTTLTIYKDDFLRYLVTIPFGGRNITRDICSLNLLEQTAERVKKTYGVAINGAAKYDSHTVIDDVDPSRIKMETLHRVVEARTEEIVENILAQIELSGYAKQLSAGMVITGGASQLDELDTLLKVKTNYDVRYGKLISDILIDKSIEITPAHSQLLGIAMVADESCCQETMNDGIFAMDPPAKKEPAQAKTEKVEKLHKAEKPEKSEKPKGLSFIDKIKERAAQLFDEN